MAATNSRDGSRRPPRVLLVSTNRERSPQPVMPVGLAAVASTLEARGLDVAVEDLCFARSPSLALGRALRRFGPDYVGLSVRNLDNADSLRPVWYLPKVKEGVGLIRRFSRAPVVIGGSAVGVAPSATLEYLGADYAVVGDGEEGISGLIETLEAGGDLGAVPGLVYRKEGAVAASPPAQRGLPHSEPRLDRWLDVRRYLRAGATVPIQTKRGCSFRCTYCTYRAIEGSRYRLREPESVVEEVVRLWRETGARDFEFVDSTFNNPLAHALKVCGEIVERRLPFRFHSGSLSPANCTEELLGLMSQGNFSLVVTAESASDRVLRSMAKGYTSGEVHGVAKALRSYRLPVLWIFLVGGQGETDDTLAETFRFIRQEVRPADVVYMTWGVRVYPGTPLAGRLRAEGGPWEERELLKPTFYVSPELDAGRALERMGAFGRIHENVITATASQHWLVPRLMSVAGALKVPHPHWRFVPMMNRLQRMVSAGPRPGGRGDINAAECRYQLR